MSDEAENRATIETFWRAWNEERLDDAMTMYAVDARQVNEKTPPGHCCPGGVIVVN